MCFHSELHFDQVMPLVWLRNSKLIINKFLEILYCIYQMNLITIKLSGKKTDGYRNCNPLGFDMWETRTLISQ